MVTRPENVAPELLVDLNYHDLEFQMNELAAVNDLREISPVVFSKQLGGYWLATGYEAVASFSRDDDLFAHKFEQNAADGVNYIGTIGLPRPPGHPGVAMNEAEGPNHAAMRRVLIPALSPTAMRALEPWMKNVADWFLDQVIEDGKADLIGEFFTSVATVVTLQTMGLPLETWRGYAHLVHSTSAYAPGTREYDEGIALFPGLMADLEEVARVRRADPKDDIATKIANLDINGDLVTDEHYGRIMFNVLAGGIDTTASLAGLSLVYLAKHPEMRERLRNDPSLLGAACEEFLRFFSVEQTISRTARTATVVDGVQIDKGDPIVLSYLGANHDPKVFERPDEVILERDVNKHVAFGLGAHRCVGANVVRSEYKIMLDTVLQRIPDYEVDFDNVKEYLGLASITGLVALPVSFTPGSKVGATPIYEDAVSPAAAQGPA
jgi:cytochrome P450